MSALNSMSLTICEIIFLACYHGYIIHINTYMSQIRLQLTGSRENEIIKHYENICDSPREIRLRVNIFSNRYPLMKEAYSSISDVLSDVT